MRILELVCIEFIVEQGCGDKGGQSVSGHYDSVGQNLSKICSGKEAKSSTLEVVSVACLHTVAMSSPSLAVLLHARHG